MVKLKKNRKSLSIPNEKKYTIGIKKRYNYKNNTNLQERGKNILLQTKIEYTISIRITQNNIFCILKDNKKKQTIILISSGILKLKVTKKKLKFVNKIFIEKFIEKIKDKLKQKTCLITLVGPKKIRKFVSRQLIFSLNKSKLVIHALHKKIFNGCRAKKVRRKKRKGLRILK